MDFTCLTQIQAAAKEEWTTGGVSFLFWERLGNKRGWEKKKHEQRAEETVRRNDKAGADPFLQASNLVADIIEKRLPTRTREP